jgi:hypothetical protein
MHTGWTPDDRLPRTGPWCVSAQRSTFPAAWDTTGGITNERRPGGNAVATQGLSTVDEPPELRAVLQHCGSTGWRRTGSSAAMSRWRTLRPWAGQPAAWCRCCARDGCLRLRCGRPLRHMRRWQPPTRWRARKRDPLGAGVGHGAPRGGAGADRRSPGVRATETQIILSTLFERPLADRD